MCMHSEIFVFKIQIYMCIITEGNYANISFFTWFCNCVNENLRMISLEQ